MPSAPTSAVRITTRVKPAIRRTPIFMLRMKVMVGFS